MASNLDRTARIAALGLSFVLSLPAMAQPIPALALQLIAEGLPQPTGITHAGDDRLFVALLRGEVWIVRDGVVGPHPFLDIAARTSAAGEQGLLSIAFHPEHATNGWLFVNYIDRLGDTVISRFALIDGDPDRADPSSEVVLLRIDQLFPNHNGGQLAFGPDGMLYVASGDGGGGLDPFCNAQDRSNLFGKILRLDVDTHADAPPFHSVPPDNPFFARLGARGEIWAWGLRNPWRLSFDRVTGDLYVADVGEDHVEEVNFLANGSPGGANFGWKIMEGDRCTGNSDGCKVPLPACHSPSLVAPILTYPNGGGNCAVTGGYVYRGAAISGLVGSYVFGDFCSGRIWVARPDGPAAWRRQELPLTAPWLQTFGEDVEGEIYLGAGDRILKLVEAEAEPEPPPLPGSCTVDDHTLCLGSGGRFAVEANFSVDGATAQPAGVRTVTADTGAFWFFDEDNLELVVKVLDACVGFGRFWVFASGLTDVATELVVTDTAVGSERRYDSPAGRAFRPVQDTDAFATCP